MTPRTALARRPRGARQADICDDLIPNTVPYAVSVYGFGYTVAVYTVLYDLSIYVKAIYGAYRN